MRMIYCVSFKAKTLLNLMLPGEPDRRGPFGSDEDDCYQSLLKLIKMLRFIFRRGSRRL